MGIQLDGGTVRVSLNCVGTCDMLSGGGGGGGGDGGGVWVCMCVCVR